MCKSPGCSRESTTRSGFCFSCYNLSSKAGHVGELGDCGCGCGQLVAGKFRQGHNARIPKYNDGVTSRFRYHHRLRMAAFNAYGRVCQCCGESQWEFLCIDHINGGGTKHRLEIGNGVEKHGAGAGMYLWLKRQGYPAGFQVLCFNCNQAKERIGGCPHQKQDVDAKRWDK